MFVISPLMIASYHIHYRSHVGSLCIQTRHTLNIYSLYVTSHPGQLSLAIPFLLHMCCNIVTWWGGPAKIVA